MEVLRTGEFAEVLAGKRLVKGLRKSTRNLRDYPGMVALAGLVGRDNVLSTLDTLTRIVTAEITDGFPYPQLFVFKQVIIICGRSTIYEYIDGALVLKIATIGCAPWRAEDFSNYVYLTNELMTVVRDSTSGVYSETTDPAAMSTCNYNNQVLIGSVNCPSCHSQAYCAYTDIQIYGLTDASGPMWGVSFNMTTLELSLIGKYIPGDDLIGLVYNTENDEIKSSWSEGATTTIRTLENLDQASFTMKEETAAFDTVDMADANFIQLSDGRYIVHDAYGMIVVFSSDLVKQGVYYDCTVVEGTDGNYYSCEDDYPWTNGIYKEPLRPVTGGSWSSYWQAVPNNEYDGVVSEYAVGSLYSRMNLDYNAGVHEYNGSLYFIRGSSSDYNAIRKLNATTFAFEEEFSGITASHYPFQSVLKDGILYLTGGVLGTCAIGAYDLTGSPIVKLDEHFVTGRLGSLCVTSQYVVHISQIYTTTWTLSVLEPATLNVVDSITYDPAVLGANDFGKNDFSRIATINDQYIFLASNEHYAVFDILNMMVVDQLKDGTPSYDDVLNIYVNK